MYLHIGGNQMVDIRRIVAMFKEHPRKSSKSNPLQQYCRPLIPVDAADTSRIRSYVVTEDCVYASPIRLETLISRYKMLFAHTMCQSGET